MEESIINLYHTVSSVFPNKKKTIIQFTGSRRGEGTSTIIREFAIMLVSKFDKSVLLIDADLHRLSHHLFFNIKPACSLEETVLGSKPTNKAICRVRNSNLFISTFSQYSFSAPDLFDSLRDGILEDESQRFDFILVDSPPVTSSTLGLSISPCVDGVILILEAEKTRWPMAENVKDKIMQSGGKILGIVFNKRRHYIPNFIYKRF